MTDDKLSRDVTEDDALANCKEVCAALSSAPFTSSLVHRLERLETDNPALDDNRENDICIVYDSRTAAKFSAALLRALETSGMKVNTVDLEKMNNENEQLSALKRLQEGGWIMLLIVSLHMLTTFWTRVQQTVRCVIGSSHHVALALWYNVAKQTGAQYAPELAQLPEWEGSNSDDTDFLSHCLFELLKRKLADNMIAFVPVRRQDHEVVQRRAVWRKHHSSYKRLKIVETLRSTFFQQKPPASVLPVVLTGASGFGKTAIAEEFIQQFQSYYADVFLLNGSTVLRWHLSVILLCELLGINARRFHQHEREQLVLSELSKSSPLLILCDDLTEACIGLLTNLIQHLKAAGNTVHVVITTRLQAVKTIDHYSVAVTKLLPSEVESLFNLHRARGTSQSSDAASSNSQIDILDGNPAACCLAKDYLAKTKSGIWALKPQYHGIWAELFFLYGKDKFSHWLEKNSITDLRDKLQFFGIHSIDDVLKAHPSFLELLQKDKDRFLTAKQSLESELDSERLQVMVHLNLNSASRTANSIMNMLSTVSHDWLNIEILVEAWLKLYKDQTEQNALKNLNLLESLGLAQLERHHDAVRAIRVPQSYQEAILHRLQAEKQTNYKKIVQCLAFVFCKRLSVAKAWDVQFHDAELLPHAYVVARHCITSSLFTVSARNLIALSRELCFTFTLGTEARQLSEHLLKMEQLVSDNHFAVAREQIHVEVAKVAIFSSYLTDQLVVDILHAISHNLCNCGQKKLAAVVLQCQVSLMTRCPEKFEQYPNVHVLLGEALLATGHPQAAIENLTKAADSPALVDDSIKLKRTLTAQAAAWEAAGDYAQAKKCYQKILELVGSNSEEQIEVLFHLGDVSNKAGHALDAFGFFSRLLSKDSEPKLQKRMKLQAQEGMGLALRNNNDLQESLSSYQSLYAMAREEGEVEFQINSLAGQADVYTAAHMLDSAVRLYQQALHLSEAKFPNHKHRAGIMNRLGNCQKSRGQFGAAKEVYEDCVSLCAHVGDKRSRAVALGSLGGIHQQMNDLKMALKYHISHLKLAEELEDEQMIVAANGNIGSCHSSLRNYDDALKFLHVAVERAETSRDSTEVGRTYSNLGNVYQLSKQYDRARQYFERSLDIAVRVGDTVGEARARGNLGNSLQSLGEYKKAVQLYEDTIRLSSMSGVNDKMSEGNAFHNKGCALEGLGKLHLAKQSFEKAIAVFHELYKQTGSSEAFRPTYLQLTSKSFRRLQYVFAKLNMPCEALEISERSRARTLANVVKMQARQGTTVTAANAQPDRVTCEDILRMVKAQSAVVILYSICRNDMHIWVIDPSSEQLNFVCKEIADDPRSESHLEKAVKTAIEEITQYENLHRLPEKKDVNESCLEKLYEWLVKPIEQWLPTRNRELVIIPANYIALVPFGALKGPDKKYFSQKYRIRSVPSVMSLDPVDDSQDRSEAVHKALVVGNPDIPPIVLPGQSEAWKPVRLPHAQREAIDVARLFNTTALTQKKATKRRVLMDMVDADAIHIATHGNQGMTSLAFSPDEDDRADMTDGQCTNPNLCLLSCQEVEALRLKAKLVVLSSCSTARGQLSGDGVMGLARSFLIAGAKAVIVTLWRVPDKATEHLMRFLYRNMQRGSPVAYSLQQAMHQLRCLEQFSHPQHWSAFEVVGSDVLVDFPLPFEVACMPDCVYFSGMEKALNTIAEWMRKDQSGLKVMYVYGMAGIGKTAMVAEFIKLHHFAFPSIFWIRGHNSVTLTSGMWKLASLGGSEFSSEDMVEKAHAYLQSLDDWLLILDGTDPATVSQYLPSQSQRGHVIITTRLPISVQERESQSGYVGVDLLLLDDAITSLLRRTGTTVKATDITAEDHSALKQLVGDKCQLAYPLALDLAAAFMRKSHHSFMSFKKMFDASLEEEKMCSSVRKKAEYESNASGDESDSWNSVASDHHGSSISHSPLLIRKSFPPGRINAAVHSLVRMLIESVSTGARWILYCSCFVNCESIPVRLLVEMATRMGEVDMNEYIVGSDEVVSKQNAALYIAEAYSTALLKKHRHTIVVKHQYYDIQSQEIGREVVSLHPFVQQCLWDHLPDSYYPFIAHSCAAALADSLSVRVDPWPADLLAAHALTFCSRLVEKSNRHLSVNAIQSCRHVVDGLRNMLLSRREFGEAFQRFMELGSEITAILKYDPRDRALLEMFCDILEGGSDVLLGSDMASHGQRSVGDIVAIEVREASHCVVLSPLRKADEEQLLCMEFFLKGAGRLFRLEQALVPGNSFSRRCNDRHLLNIARDILLALKSIHDEGSVAQLLRTRVTGDRILIDKDKMCAWLITTEFDTAALHGTVWTAESKHEDGQQRSPPQFTLPLMPDNATGSSSPQKPWEGREDSESNAHTARFVSQDPILTTSGLGDSMVTGEARSASAHSSDSGAQESRTGFHAASFVSQDPRQTTSGLGDSMVTGEARSGTAHSSDSGAQESRTGFRAASFVCQDRRQSTSGLGHSTTSEGSGKAHFPDSETSGRDLHGGSTGSPTVQSPTSSRTVYDQPCNVTTSDPDPDGTTQFSSVIGSGHTLSGDMGSSGTETVPRMGPATVPSAELTQTTTGSSSQILEYACSEPDDISNCERPSSVHVNSRGSLSGEHISLPSEVVSDVSGSVATDRSQAQNQSELNTTPNGSEQDWVVIETYPVISSPQESRIFQLRSFGLLLLKMVRVIRDLSTDFGFDSITSSEALDALLRVEPKDQVLPAISRIIHKCLIESCSVDDVLDCVDGSSQFGGPMW